MKLEPWKTGLAEVSFLKPHEQSIQRIVDKLAEDIKKSGRIIHPVIVDASTGLVVDGTHRVEAAKHLKLRYIPVYSVDYLSEKIVLDGWGRILKKPAEFRRLFDEAVKIGFKPCETTAEASVCFFTSSGSASCLSLEEADVHRLYEKISKLESYLSKFDIMYVPEPQLMQALVSGGSQLGYRIRLLRKTEVLNLVERGFRLPPKSTRHVVDRRPMFVLCPLEILRSVDAESLFHDWLSRGSWVELGEGVELDRRYDEKVAVFYREDLRNLYPPMVLELLKAVKA
ncbi:MAG: ParB N-terminal domain-containing protein [Candidatus Caldarchaeum sp.]|nr:ParB N-terminal domain-containing protein [Candidatus Caldarchaeum sp.]